jgi:hypothetical protein
MEHSPDFIEGSSFADADECARAALVRRKFETKLAKNTKIPLLFRIAPTSYMVVFDHYEARFDRRKDGSGRWDICDIDTVANKFCDGKSIAKGEPMNLCAQVLQRLREIAEDDNIRDRREAL